MKFPYLKANSTKVNPSSKPAKSSWKRKLLIGCGIAAVFIIVAIPAMTWFSSGMLLHPSFKGLGKNFSKCSQESERYFGKDCGNLNESHAYVFSNVKIPSQNGYDMPGWLIKASDNARTQKPSHVIMLVHSGGSDRREMTRHIGMYLDQGFDVLTFDQGCAGESPCPVKGLSYGQRESRDVASAYQYLLRGYDHVYAMGSSVGAASILVALPEMTKLAGAIIENPYTSFDRLVKEAPESKNVPGWATNMMISLTKMRGEFDGLASPEQTLPFSGNTIPIFFIHSKKDKVASYKQTEDLVGIYTGPKTVWYPDAGDHALISNAQPSLYKEKIAAFLATTP